MNKTFCVLPWVNITTHPDGSIKPCCVSQDFIRKPNGENYNLGKDSIEEIYNSPDYINIRTKMLNGEEVSGCGQCYAYEKYGGSSNRIIYNNQWRFRTFDNPIAETKIQYFDLRFGNLCNLSCRSCQPDSSSMFAKESSELQSQGMSKFHPIYTDVDDWYESNTFDSNVNGQLDNLLLVYLTGGEPTIIDKNIEIFQRLIDTGNSDKVRLLINSNMTNLKPAFHDMLSKFKAVTFNASIDGYGDMQEYLRYPSKWSQIDSNIKKLVLTSKVTIKPTPVIQTTNLNKIVDLFEYFEIFNREQDRLVMDMMPIILENPSHLNLVHLPTKYKKMCWDRIEEWLNTKCKYQTPAFHNRIQGLKNKCVTIGDQAQLKTYLEYNTLFDRNRNHWLKDINPELYSIL